MSRTMIALDRRATAAGDAARKNHAMRMYRVTVSRRAQLTPGMVRLTFSGPDLDFFMPAGPDQRVKLLLPHPGQTRPLAPYDMTPRELRALPEPLRPIMRTYTVRYFRPGVPELDIDFALHEPAGPAGRWAAEVRSGGHAALYGPACAYEPPAGCGWQLLAGDETALPAIGAIVEALPAGVRAEVFAEVDDAGERQSWHSAADVRVHWLYRGGAPAGSGSALLDAVAAADLSDEPHRYAWLAAERYTAAQLRRHLVERRGFPRSAIYFSGYWRLGKAENEV